MARRSFGKNKKTESIKELEPNKNTLSNKKKSTKRIGK
jgi:hypothetical protein